MIITTLALGKPYWRHALYLANDLRDFGRGLNITTENRSYFSRYNHINTHPLIYDRFHFNLKCHAYRNAISQAKSILWIDADTVISESVHCKVFERAISFDFPPGLHVHETHNRSAFHYPLTEEIANDWKLDYDDTNITYQERLVVLNACGKEKRFLDLWEHMGNELIKRGYFGGGDGTVMAICAQATGVPCHGSKYFSHSMLSTIFKPMRHHYPLGIDLRQLRKFRARLKGQWPVRPSNFVF